MRVQLYSFFLLQGRRKNPYVYRRDIFYRYRCVPKEFRAKDRNFIDIIEKGENNILKNVSLSVQVINTECRPFSRLTLTKNDTTFL